MPNTPLQDIQELQLDVTIFDSWLHDGTGVMVDFSAAQDGSDMRPSLAAYLASVGFGHPNLNGPVNAAQTTALPAFTYANGALGVGATITANANGALSAACFDTVAPVLGNRVFVGLHGSSNGIYVITQVGDGTHPFILTRDTSADTALELGFLWAFIGAGATLMGYVWLINLDPTTIVVGTTALPVQLVAGSAAVAGETARAEAAESAVQNGLKKCAVTQVASFALDGTNWLWPVDATGGNIVVTVPAGAGFANQEWCIKRLDNTGNTVTVLMQVGETIDGAPNYVLAGQWSRVRFINKRGSTTWYITGT